MTASPRKKHDPRAQALRRRATKLGLDASKPAGGEWWRITRRYDGRNVPVVAGSLERCERFLEEQAALLSV